MKIRVAHIVNPTFGLVFSGHAHYLFSLLSGWKEEDIYLDLYGTHVKPSNMNSGDRNYQMPTGTLWSNPKKQTRWGRIRWSYNLLEILIRRRKEYDIVHFHALSWGGLISPLILHPLGKKVVFSMIRYGNDNPSYIRQLKHGRLQVALLRKFDGAIGISPALVNDALNHGIRNVICLPNFMAIPQIEKPPILDQRLLMRSKLNIPIDATILLYIGVAHRRKGLDVLVDAFIELRKNNPNLWLIIVGPRSKEENNLLDGEIIPQITKKIQEVGLQNRIIWVGMINDLNELARCYWASDIFVLPTRNEGLGNVLIEAGYAELPVVVSDLPGITDTVIKNRENGYLVPVDDTQGFVHSIEALVSNPKLRKSMGYKGRLRAIELFGFDMYCKKLKDYYFEIIRK